MRSFRKHLLVLFACLLLSTAASAEVVVVVGAKSGVSQLTQDEVINIFLGRHRKLPNGQAALPYDLPTTDTMRADFYRRLVDKSIAEINAYWARLLFSGKTNPPQSGLSSQDVLKAVASVPGAIGYLDRSQADERVRIVLSLGE